MHDSFIPTAFHDRALSLLHLGVNEVAWRRSDALAIVACLSGTNLAVLGGDVLTSFNGAFVYTGCSWYANRQPGESWPSYTARSLQTALDYIASYPLAPEDQQASRSFSPTQRSRALTSSDCPVSSAEPPIEPYVASTPPNQCGA